MEDQEILQMIYREQRDAYNMGIDVAIELLLKAIDHKCLDDYDVKICSEVINELRMEKKY